MVVQDQSLRRSSDNAFITQLEENGVRMPLVTRNQAAIISPSMRNLRPKKEYKDGADSYATVHNIKSGS